MTIVRAPGDRIFIRIPKKNDKRGPEKVAAAVKKGIYYTFTISFGPGGILSAAGR